MNYESEKTGRRRITLRLILLLPVLYVLSSGPVGMWTLRHSSSNHAFEWIYAPVIWLYDHTPLQKPLKAYRHLWGF